MFPLLRGAAKSEGNIQTAGGPQHVESQPKPKAIIIPKNFVDPCTTTCPSHFAEKPKTSGKIQALPLQQRPGVVK